MTQSESPLGVYLDPELSVRGEFSGIGRYAAGVIQGLRKICDTKVANEVIIAVLPRGIRRYAHILVANLSVLLVTRQVIHYLNHYVPWCRGRALKVVTIYDLSALKFPESVSPLWRRTNQQHLRKAVRRADVIMTISQSIREEILREFVQVRPQNVHVSPCGVQDFFGVADQPTRLLTRLGVPRGSYFLCVGDMTLRKNVPFVLEVFSEMVARGELLPETRLLLVGKRAFGFGDIKKRLASSARVVFTGYVPAEELPGIFRYAKALIFPSIYEGFGIPLLEAMSQNTPIIGSRIPTTVELDKRHNGQMFLYNPHDGEALAKHIQSLDREADQIKESLRYGDLSCYSYEAIARRHLEIYRQALAARDHPQ
jgi:glycosyltransferase involved in cell wall biosynthesis